MFNFIFKRFLDNLNRSSLETIDTLKKQELSNTNFYQTLSFIPPKKIILYILIAIVFITIFRNLKLNVSAILGFLIFIFVIYFLINKDRYDEQTFIEQNNTKIQFLTEIMYDTDKFEIMFRDDQVFTIQPRIKEFYLHKNELLVELFYNLRSLYSISPKNYVSTLIYSNYVIALEQNLEIGVNNPFENLRTAKFYYKQALNAFESLIHSIEKNNLRNFDHAIKLLQSILLKVLNNMINVCKNRNEKDGLTTQSIPNDNLDNLLKVEPDNTQDIQYMPNYDYF